MDVENDEKIKKYERTSYLEFFVKPSLFLDYVKLLKITGNRERIDLILENYIDLFQQFCSKANITMETLNTELLKADLKLKKTLHLIIILIFHCELNLRVLWRKAISKEFMKILFDCIELKLEKSKLDGRREYFKAKELILRVAFHCDSILHSYSITPPQNEIFEKSTVQGLLDLCGAGKISKELMMEGYYQVSYFYFIQDKFDRCVGTIEKFEEIYRGVENFTDMISFLLIENNKLQGMIKIISGIKKKTAHSNVESPHIATADIMGTPSKRENSSNSQMILERQGSGAHINLSDLKANSSNNSDMKDKQIVGSTGKNNNSEKKGDQESMDTDMSLKDELCLANKLLNEYFIHQDKNMLAKIDSVFQISYDADPNQFNDSTLFLAYLILKTDEVQAPAQDVYESIKHSVDMFGNPPHDKIFLLYSRYITFCDNKKEDKNTNAMVIEAPKNISHGQKLLEIFTFMLEKLNSKNEIEVVDVVRTNNLENLTTTILLCRNLIQMQLLTYQADNFFKEEGQLGQFDNKPPRVITELNDEIHNFWSLLKNYFIEQKAELLKTYFSSLTCLQSLTIIKNVLLAILVLIKEQYSRADESFHPRLFNFHPIKDITFDENDYFKAIHSSMKLDQRFTFKACDFEKDKGTILFYIDILYKQEAKLNFLCEIKSGQEDIKGAKLNLFDQRELNFRKNDKKLQIERIKVYFLFQDFKKVLKLSLKLMSSSVLAKVNLIDKPPEIYNRQILLQIIIISLFYENALSECLIMLQFIEGNILANYITILDSIRAFPHYYVSYVVDMFLLEKLAEKAYLLGDEAGVSSIIDRIKHPDCYQFLTEAKKIKINNILRINFFKGLYSTVLSNQIQYDNFDN